MRIDKKMVASFVYAKDLNYFYPPTVHHDILYLTDGYIAIRVKLADCNPNVKEVVKPENHNTGRDAGRCDSIEYACDQVFYGKGLYIDTDITAMLQMKPKEFKDVKDTFYPLGKYYLTCGTLIKIVRLCKRIGGLVEYDTTAKFGNSNYAKPVYRFKVGDVMIIAMAMEKPQDEDL